MSLAERAIPRPRLVEMLDGRFVRRLTIVVGGAGLGKTTLLQQASLANLEDPAGLDIWLACEPADDRESALVSGLRTALGADASHGDGLDDLLDALLRRSPQDVTLILDDVHHLTPGGASARFLERLVDSAPANAHFVLASRVGPPFVPTRWMALGEVVEIDDETLQFDVEERAAFLADRGLDSDLELGGWPAGLELAATVGADRVGDYLFAEVCGRLEPERRRALSRVASLDWIDDRRIAEVAGGSMSVDELVAGLPLVSRGQGGVARLHALWRPVLDAVDCEWAEGQIDRAVSFLCESDSHREALSFVEAQGETLRAHEIVRSFAVITRWLRASTSDLEVMCEAFPAELKDTGSGRFLDGLLLLHNDPVRAFPLLAEARALFHQAEELELELCSMSTLGFLTFFAGAAELLRAICRQLDDLPPHPAMGSMRLASEFQALLLEGEARRVLEVADGWVTTDLGWQMLRNSITGLAALDAGEPERVLAHQRGDDHLLPPIFAADAFTTRAEARWLLGELDAAALHAIEAELDRNDVGYKHTSVVLRSLLCFMHAALGESEEAGRLLEQVERGAVNRLGPRAAMAVSAARMMFAALEGREAEAALAMADAFAEEAGAIRLNRHLFRALPTLYVVDPTVRVAIDELDVGSCFAQGLAAARALVRVREEGLGDAAASLPWREEARFRCYFVAPMFLELALAAAAEGNSEALEIARELAERFRPTLAAAAETSESGQGAEKRRKVARSLLTEVPSRPSGVVRIEVLGRLRILRDGRPVDDPYASRDRVRVLLQYLVWKRRAPRRQLAQVLWPDLEVEAAMNNLRVNLNYLTRVLEPRRTRREPSYFVRSVGDEIELRVGDALRIDQDDFDSALREAEDSDRDGRAAEALLHYERAVSVYGGDYLEEGAERAWAEAERTRLRSRFKRAALRTAELLLGRGELDAALDPVHRVIEADDLDQSAHRMHALIYFRMGDLGAARDALGSAFRRLDESGVAASSQLLRLADRVGGLG